MSETNTGVSGRYDFGLGSAQEERARRLHHESIIVDLVSQHVGGSNIYEHYPDDLKSDLRIRLKQSTGWALLTDVEYWPYEMARCGKSHLIRDWYESSGLTCGTYGIGVHDGHDPTCIHLDAANAVFADLPWLQCVTTESEIRHAKRDGKVALYAQWQPYIAWPRDLKAIDVAYIKGLRSFMLTYNQMDHVGVGCTERVDAGLSMFGLEVVKHCNATGIVVDVSHCGHLTTLDACRHSTKPVTANHTAARGIHTHARGKNDEALRAIADTGGVIGVVAAPPFLTSDPAPTVEHMLDHIDYIVELVGWRYVAIGTDWPQQAPLDVLKVTLEAGAKSIGFREEDHLDLTLRLDGFQDARDLPNITRGLVKRGYSDEQIRGVLGENVLRVFSEVWR